MKKRLFIPPMSQAWIKDRLKEVKSTQVKLADAMGLAASRVNEIVAEERQVRLDEALPMAKHLQMNYIELIARLTDTPQSDFDAGATGDSGLDEELLQTVVEELETVLTNRQLTLSPEKRARAMAMLYKYYISEDGPADGLNFAAQLLRVV